MNTATSFFSSVVRGFTWIGLGIVTQGLVRVGVLAVMARLVSPRDFGLVGIAFIFTNFAERVGQIGVGSAFVQRAEVTDDDKKTALILSLLSGCGIAGILSGSAPYVATMFSEPEVVPVLSALALGFIIDGFGVVSDSILQRDLRFREIVRAESVALVVGVAGVGITLGVMGWGVWALVCSNLVFRFFRTSLLVLACPITRGGAFSVASAKRLMSTGVGFSLGRVLNFLSLQGDNFVVGRVLGTEVLGMYTRAYQAMTLPAMYVGQAFDRVLFPALAQKQEDPGSLKRGLLGTLEMATLVALPVSVGMHLLSEELILVLFGTKWRAIIPVLSILSLGVFFRTAYKCSDVLIRSQGRVYNYAAGQALYTMVIVVGSFVGAMVSGVTGVAYAVVVGVAVNYVVMTRLAGALVQASPREVLDSHIPGLWVSAWMWAGLTLCLPSIRGVTTTPLVVLATAVIVAVVAGLVGGVCARPFVRSSLLYKLVQRALNRRTCSPRSAFPQPSVR